MYSLDLTTEEVSTIDFMGDRYGWSEALRTLMGKGFESGTLDMAEHEAWKLKDAFEEDTEGGHSFFPMLDHSSELAGKLFALMEEII